MYLPVHLAKPVAFWGISAATVVWLSGVTMAMIESRHNSAINLATPATNAEVLAQIVSQNAVAPEASAAMPAVAASGCTPTLELMDEGNGTIGGTLLAPCLANQDLVIAHAGMVFSAKTMASGALFFSLPALKSPASVNVRFSSGEEADGQLDMPEVLGQQRVVVQWPFADGFGIHAFENGANFGGKGHIWAQNPTGQADMNTPANGYLTMLGDASVELPLMAQVFTYAPNMKTEVILEAAVTENNCDGELTGDLFTARGGDVQKTEMVLAMPACDAVGEFVHLGLPEQTTNLAMSN